MAQGTKLSTNMFTFQVISQYCKILEGRMPPNYRDNITWKLKQTFNLLCFKKQDTFHFLDDINDKLCVFQCEKLPFYSNKPLPTIQYMYLGINIDEKGYRWAKVLSSSFCGCFFRPFWG
jgi:hypothetical protein